MNQLFEMPYLIVKILVTLSEFDSDDCFIFSDCFSPCLLAYPASFCRKTAMLYRSRYGINRL